MYIDPFKKGQWDTPNQYPHTTTTSTYPKAPKKVSAPTINDLFPNIDRRGIGFETVFRMLTEFDTKPTQYPPHNIIKYEDGKWEVQMALAGFSKKDIEITVKDKVLTVSNIIKEDQVDYPGEFVHHGIASRDFTTTFALAEYVEVESAKMVDGILTIKLFTNIPEDKKPKVIDIK